MLLEWGKSSHPGDEPRSKFDYDDDDDDDDDDEGHVWLITKGTKKVRHQENKVRPS